MPNDGSDLGQLERKIPHISFLMELFSAPECQHRWDVNRLGHFARLRQIISNCWDNLQTFARQMAGNKDFQLMLKDMQEAMARIRIVERHIRESPLHRHGFRSQMMDGHAGAGVRLC